MAPLPLVADGVSDLPRILAFNISTCAIAFLAVLVRLGCRLYKKTALWWDDLLVIVSLFLAMATLLMYILWLIPNGFGISDAANQPVQVSIWRYGLFIHEMLFPLTLLTAKSSVLLTFWRGLHLQLFRIFVVVLMTVIALWAGGIVAVTALQCWPASFFWTNPSSLDSGSDSIPGCGYFDGMAYLHAIGIGDIAVDAMILLLPLPFVWAFCIVRRQKIALGIAILLGLITILIAIGRYYYSLQLDFNAPGSMWYAIDIELWMVIECNLSIATACVVSMYSLPQTRANVHMLPHASKRSIGSRGLAWWKAQPRTSAPGGRPPSCPILSPLSPSKERPFMRMSDEYIRASEESMQTEDEFRRPSDDYSYIARRPTLGTISTVGTATSFSTYSQ